MSDKKISIITVAYNNLAGLKHTAASVFGQTCQDFEYIVVDGGSGDGTREWLEANDAQIDWWCSEMDGGIFPAMNKGIRQASGEYCIFMNSGDRFFNADVIEKVVPLLNGKDFYTGNEQKIGAQVRLAKAPQEIRASYLAVSFLPHQATFIRTALLKRRPYDERYRLVSDWRQMLEELVVYNASYEALPLVVSEFDTEGISSHGDMQQKLRAEMDAIRRELLPLRVIEEYLGYDKFDAKVRYALNCEDKVHRDWKILRNALKALPRDIWDKMKQKRK